MPAECKNDMQSTCNRKNVTNLIVVCNNRRFIVLEYNNAERIVILFLPFDGAGGIK